jgi:putative redox protein
MKAVIESLGKVASRTEINGHTLVFDQPASVPGGEDRGPSPLDVMVVAVAACAHYYAAAYLHGRGLATEQVRVEVEAEKDRTPVARIGRLDMTVHLPAGLTDMQIAGVERAIKNCPAYGTLLHPPAIHIGVDANNAAAPARAANGMG